METIVFEFIPAAKAIDEVNNRKKSRKNRKKSNKDTSLRANDNNHKYSDTTDIKTVTIAKDDYHKLITEYQYREKCIKDLTKKLEFREKQYCNYKNESIEYAKLTEQFKIEIENKNKEIALLKAIIKDIKETVITMCNNIK